jgi:hypothetical protein
MARLEVDGDDLLLRLTWREKIAGFRANIRIPLSAIRAVTVPPNAWLAMRGWRMAGIAFPGYVAIGTRRHADGYDFTVVKKTAPAVQVEVNTGRFQRFLISVPNGVDADSEANRIADAAGIARPPG